MTIDFAKYQPAKRTPDVVGAARAAADSFAGVGSMIQRNRQLAQQKAYQEEQVRLEDQRQQNLLTEGEARRGHESDMFERGQKFKELQAARASEAKRQASVLELQMKAQQAAQAGDEANFAVFSGALGHMGVEVGRSAPATQPVAPAPHSLAGAAAMESGELPGPPPQGDLPGVLSSPGMPEPNVVPRGMPLPPQEQALPPSLGPNLRLAGLPQPGPAGDFAPPPQALSSYNTSVAPPSLGGPGVPSPFDAGAISAPSDTLAPVPFPAEAVPAIPELTFTDTTTGKSMSVPMSGTGSYEHPEAEMAALAEALVPESQRKYIEAAVPIVRAYMGDSNLPDQLDKILEWTDKMADNDRETQRLKRQGRGGGGGGGKSASINQILSTYRLENQEFAKHLAERDFTGVRESGVMLQKGLALLNKEDLSMMDVEGVVTMLATSIQSGVLSNQDKKAWERLPGWSGSLEKWWAENVTKSPPKEHAAQLRSVMGAMTSQIRGQMGSIYRDAETMYKGADVGYRNAIMSGDHNNAEVMKYRRSELERDIKSAFHKNHWKNLFGPEKKPTSSGSAESRLKSLGID